MLNCCTSQVRWHFNKTLVEIKSGHIFLCIMYKMFRFIKPLLGVLNFRKSFPYFMIHFGQIRNCLTINPQCLVKGNILFFNFYTITGYRLHEIFLLSLFFLLLPFNVRQNLFFTALTHCHYTIGRIPKVSTPQLLF